MATKPTTTDTSRSAQPGRERRDYFRVADTIPLWWQVCSEPDFQSAEEYFPELADQGWYTEVCALEDELVRQLSTMEANQAAPLRLLQRQLGLLAGRLHQQSPKAPASAINLSEGGLAFYSPTAPAPGTKLALGLLLPHSLRTLFCYAEVARTTEEVEHGYEVAVVFSNLSDTARQWIVRQVLHAQRSHRQEANR